MSIDPSSFNSDHVNLNFDNTVIDLGVVDELSLDDFDFFEHLFADAREKGSDVHLFDPDIAAKKLIAGEVIESDLDHFIIANRGKDEVFVSQNDKLNKLKNKNVYLCKSGMSNKKTTEEQIDMSKVKFKPISEEKYKVLVLLSAKTLNIARERLLKNNTERSEGINKKFFSTRKFSLFKEIKEKVKKNKFMHDNVQKKDEISKEKLFIESYFIGIGKIRKLEKFIQFIKEIKIESQDWRLKIGRFYEKKVFDPSLSRD